jgi:hypothetical protein
MVILELSYDHQEFGATVSWEACYLRWRGVFPGSLLITIAIFRASNLGAAESNEKSLDLSGV